jgi:hypothetical protein
MWVYTAVLGCGANSTTRATAMGTGQRLRTASRLASPWLLVLSSIGNAKSVSVYECFSFILRPYKPTQRFECLTIQVPDMPTYHQGGPAMDKSYAVTFGLVAGDRGPLFDPARRESRISRATKRCVRRGTNSPRRPFGDCGSPSHLSEIIT